MVKELFVVDLDGTLLGDDKGLASEDMDALARLRYLGVVTAIATGRSYYSFQKKMVELNEDWPGQSLPIDYVIFSTGAGIMNFPGSDILKKRSLARDDVIKISNILYGCRLDYMIHRPVPETNHFIYNYYSGANSDFKTRLDLYKDYAAILTPDSLAGFGEATQFLCIVDRSKGDRVMRQLSDIFSEYSVIKATSPMDGCSIWVEIFSKDVCKSKAVAWLCRKIGVCRQDVCAVGNDYNDEDLLRWAGRGYLVANGPESLQGHYPLVASNNEGGVAEAAIRWLHRRSNT